MYKETTLLKRLGNKSQLSKEIQAYFPKHNYYIEPFFGAGGMFFNKPLAKHNILNDSDDDVFNLFNVIINNKEELAEKFSYTVHSTKLFTHWRYNKEKDPILKAVRFLYISAYGFLGMPQHIRITLNKSSYKSEFDKRIASTYKMLDKASFTGFDFRELFDKISIKRKKIADNTFIYCDPPYQGTLDNYKSRFKKKDLIDLIEVLNKTKMKFAISEFKNQIPLALAQKYNLNVIEIRHRNTLKGYNTEILITNYTTHQLRLF